MKKAFTKSRLVSAGVACFAVFAVCADGMVLSGNTYRIQDATNAHYSVSSAFEAAEWPAGIPTPSFRFDCTDTNGWEFVIEPTTGRKLVTRIPSLVVGSARYLSTNVNNATSTYPGWRPRPPIFVESEPALGGRSMIDLCDGRSLNTLMGLVFDAEGDSQSEHQLQSIGTIVAVYGSDLGGGSFLGGGVINGNCHVWSRQRDATISSENPDTSRVDYPAPIAGYKASESFRTGLVRHFGHPAGARDAGFSGGWEVLSVICSDNSNPATGIGLGDADANLYYHSGGMKIAEMVFFTETLSTSQVAKVERFLARKWFPKRREDVGYNGRTSLGWYRANSKTKSITATFEIPEKETLDIGRLQGGRVVNGVEPRIVKTGNGTLKVGDFGGYGGTLEVQAGEVAFDCREIPTVETLPEGLFVRFDASDASCLDISEDGSTGRKYVKGLRNLANGTLLDKPVAAFQIDENYRPWILEGHLNGRNVIDFGLTSEGETRRWMRYGTYSDGEYSAAFIPSVFTVVAVIGAHNGGGHLMDNMMHRSQVELYGTGVFSGFENCDAWNKVGLLSASKFGCESARQLSGKDGIAFVNGRMLDDGAQGYEVSGYQVAAWRVPGYRCSFLGGANEGILTGNIRIGEVLVWLRPLSDEEICDAQSYLSRKWLGQTLAGYAYDALHAAPQVQKVEASGDVEINVPSNGVVRIGSLIGGGKVSKTGEGALYIGSGSALAGGLEIKSGTVRTVDTPVTGQCQIAASPALHLDASDLGSFIIWPKNGTNFVHRWIGLENRNGAVMGLVDQSGEGEIPERNNPWLDSENTLNGMPCVNFGSPDYKWGRKAPTMRLDHAHDGVRSVFVVYGGQNGGNDLFGSTSGVVFDSDSDDHTDWPCIDDGTRMTSILAYGANANIVSGEIFMDGVRTNNTANPQGWSLLEFHTLGGVHISALNCRHQNTYNRGGNRYCEIIVYERPLTEREKTATRNYLTHKWFPSRELQPLPAASPAEFSGDVTFGPDATLGIDASEGMDSCALTLTGTLSFAAGASVNVTGASSLCRKLGSKVAIAKASSYTGLENVNVVCDAETSPANAPFLTVGKYGMLYAKFGIRGLVIYVR